MAQPEPAPITLGVDGYQPERLLSLIAPARNDAYMGDFKWRFSTSLNYLAQNLEAIGRLNDVEMVVCDWNSDVPLWKELTLTPAARELVRFVVVPPEIARPAQRDSPFPIVLAQNVAIRRCRGAFIGQTDSDILYTPASLMALFNVLDGKLPGVPVQRAYLAAPRRHVPVGLVRTQPCIQDLHEYLMRSGNFLREDQPGAGYAAPTALVLMHRSIWQACRGYDQAYLYWGWMDIDLALRVTQVYPLLYLSNFGVNLFHLEHYVQRDYSDRTHQPRKVNIANDFRPFAANDSHWGMADHVFEAYRVANTAPLPGPAEHWLPGRISLWDIDAATWQAQLADPAAQQLALQVGQAFQLPAWELNSLNLLAWYALHMHPRNYVEIGLRSAHAAALVARACPGVEIAGIVSWQRDQLDESSFAYGSHFALTGTGQHQASTRYVGGDPDTAVRRLVESNLGRFAVSLGLIRANAAHAAEQGIELARYLVPSGALVVVAEEPRQFSEVWDRLHAAYPQFTYARLDDGRTGMILAARLGGQPT